MKLSELTYRTARLITKVRKSVLTSGSDTTNLVDNTLIDQSGTYTGGIVWILSGTYIDTVQAIKSHGSGTVELTTALAGSPPAGVEYAISRKPLSIYQLKEACQDAMRRVLYVQENTTTLVTDDTREYALPANVSHILSVEVELDDFPYYERNFYWEEQGGKLIFDDGWQPDDAGKKIKLRYLAGASADIALTAAVPHPADAWRLLTITAALIISEEELRAIGKDDEMAMELFNKMKADEALERMHYYQNMPSRDPHYAAY